MKQIKKIGLLLWATLLSLACNSQENKPKEEPDNLQEAIKEAPKGSWEVNREFDEAGNLIRYDSVYSWSSGDDLNELATFDRDSILKSMQSRFYRNFSQFDFEKEGFGDLFAEDSLFTKRFFNNDFFGNDFGKDFMNLDKMHERMEAMRKRFMERYQPLMDSQKDADSLQQDQ